MNCLLPCPKCGKAITYGKSLLEHILSHHPIYWILSYLNEAEKPISVNSVILFFRAKIALKLILPNRIQTIPNGDCIDTPKNRKES